MKYINRVFWVMLGLIVLVQGQASYVLMSSQYSLITSKNAQMLQSDNSKKPLVTEFFSFACKHCYHLEKPLEKWVKDQKGHIFFQKIPVTWNRAKWHNLAKAYYIAKALKMRTTLMLPLFKAIHVKGQDLSQEAILSAFFAKYGVKPSMFEQYYNSPTIDYQVKHAEELSKAFRVSQVPTIIINNQFQTSLAQAGGQGHLFTVLNALVVKAKKG